MHKKLNAFTFVELMIVIIILTTISMIWFSSYTSHLSWVRDTNRISQLRAISESLKIYSVFNRLPYPDERVSIKNDTDYIAYQGYLWEESITQIKYSWDWVDPENWTPFSYYLDSNRKNFQLMSFLENNKDKITYKETVSKTNAIDYDSIYPYVDWKDLWIMTWTWDDLNKPIQELWIDEIDISSVSTPYVSYINNDLKLVWNSEVLYVLEWIKDAWGIWANCKELIDSRPSLEWKDWYYLIKPRWEKAFIVHCNMSLYGWWWTRYTEYSSSMYYVNELWDLVENFDELFYSYKRSWINDKYAFRFKKLWTKQCGDEHWHKSDLKLALRDYVDHIENESWWYCWRNSTTGDANDIEIEKIINFEFKNDDCVTWNLNKTSGRNYSWSSVTTSDWKSVGDHVHRISNHTVLFWPRWNWSSRCAWANSWPSASEVYMYLR